MKIRVGNEVRFTREFYGDSYEYAACVEGYDELEKLIDTREFEHVLKSVVGTVKPYSSDMLFVTVNLFRTDYELLVGIDDIQLTPESIKENSKADKLAKLSRQEAAGQMRMF